eukprot:CAMPEP_0181189012 /NCGR_PEP_ID=MMETSP1096-20121128/11435_1 /TAXON_ID=156174 ORGANISM="Chrysochromulina ericina, Strain CCMP281" /NCGR_SAMPLE_ID=MMETSP1096 /ASSEMBLY_ACC=CAM_ASM_000453 /LENGTH=198 /DNA_ID=CAMNT_0023278137 /DNA_START=78 /DNA_END=674 /DNA_ORIENTATION=+
MYMLYGQWGCLGYFIALAAEVHAAASPAHRVAAAQSPLRLALAAAERRAPCAHDAGMPSSRRSIRSDVTCSLNRARRCSRSPSPAGQLTASAASISPVRTRIFLCLSSLVLSDGPVRVQAMHAQVKPNRSSVFRRRSCCTWPEHSSPQYATVSSSPALMSVAACAVCTPSSASHASRVLGLQKYDGDQGTGRGSALLL